MKTVPATAKHDTPTMLSRVSVPKICINRAVSHVMSGGAAVKGPRAFSDISAETGFPVEGCASSNARKAQRASGSFNVQTITPQTNGKTDKTMNQGEITFAVRKMGNSSLAGCAESVSNWASLKEIPDAISGAVPSTDLSLLSSEKNVQMMFSDDQVFRITRDESNSSRSGMRLSMRFLEYLNSRSSSESF